MRELTAQQLKQLIADTREEAFLFYDAAKEKFIGTPLHGRMVKMSQAEAEKDHLSTMINSLELIYPE